MSFRKTVGALCAVLLAGLGVSGLASAASADDASSPTAIVDTQAVQPDVSIDQAPVAEPVAASVIEPAPAEDAVVSSAPAPVDAIAAPEPAALGPPIAEARTVAPAIVEQWLTWKTSLKDGVTTPKNGSDVTWDQPFVGVGQVPAPCGVWHQQDLVRGTAEQIAALYADHFLRETSPGHYEDASLVQNWVFVYGGACPPPTPTVTLGYNISCGTITLTTTNNESVPANWYYGLKAMVGSTRVVSAVQQGPGTKTSPYTFAEDQGGGSVAVDVTVYAATEQDLLPAAWPYGYVEHVTVTTNCVPNQPGAKVLHRSGTDNPVCTVPNDGTSTTTSWTQDGTQPYVWNADSRSWVLGAEQWNDKKYTPGEATPDANCPPPATPPLVVPGAGEWIDGKWECGDTTVTQTQETWTVTTTYTPTFVEGAWVQVPTVGAKVFGKSNTKVRDLTNDELCPVVLPVITYVDQCGTKDDKVNMPDAIESITVKTDWTAPVASVFATPAAGYRFVTPLTDGWTLGDDGTAVWSTIFGADACPVPVVPPTTVVGLASTGSDLRAGILAGVLLLMGSTMVYVTARRRRVVTEK